MKLLATLDFDRTTADVLRSARLWTRRLDAELFLLHVAAPNPDFMGYGAGHESARLAAAHKFTRAHQRLEAIATELRKEGIPSTTALLVQGEPIETILREAERISADAILMGIRTRGTTRPYSLGTTSKRVLAESTRPVLFIPPEERA